MRKLAALAGVTTLAVLMGACSLLPKQTAEVGECINVDTSSAVVDELKGFECSKEHDGEVYLKDKVDFGGDYDETKIDEAAREMCLTGFNDYVGIDYYSSTLDIYYMVPLEDGWKSGDREVLCSVYTPNYDTGDIVRTTGSLKGAKK